MPSSSAPLETRAYRINGTQPRFCLLCDSDSICTRISVLFVYFTSSFVRLKTFASRT